MEPIQQPAGPIIQQALHTAFAEDWGMNGDVTSRACIASDRQVHAQLYLRGDKSAAVYVLAGLELAKAAFLYDNTSLSVELQQQDGAVVACWHSACRNFWASPAFAGPRARGTQLPMPP